MTYELKWRLVCVLFLILVVFWFVWSGDRKQRFVPANNISPKYASFPYLLWFPGYLLYFYILTCMEHRPHYEEAYPVLFSLCFVFFLHLTVYYGLLLLALPALRARLQARTCAVLWLLPCLLAVFVHPSSSEMFLALSPVLTIPVSSALASTLGKIWSFGFFAVLIWKIAVHLQFCEKIESSSKKITDSEILRVWEQEQKATGEYPLLSSDLLQSPLIRTPLSIGFMDTTILLVLPDRSYTQDDLKLIFRHEIIHIQRKDAQTKLFMAFCAALCWFNPFMWKSLQACTADLELSCDETLLAGADEETRHHYGKLLLHTAGDARGFTTCLSASAESLRYRLKHIMAPRSGLKRGGLIIAAITFALVMSVGLVSLSYERLPADQIMPAKSAAQEVFAERAVHYSAPGYGDCLSTNFSALDEYIRSLEVHKITGYYSFKQPDRYLSISYVKENGRETTVFLTDYGLMMNRYATVDKYDMYDETYYISQDIDWAYIESLLEPAA